MIYTAPKTGSTSLEAALATAGVPAVKVHFLGRGHERVVARHRAQGLPLNRHHLVEARIGPLLAEGGRRFRVVSLARDPVAQKVSTVFQSPRLWRLDTREPEAVRRHVAAQVERMAETGSALSWFEDELGATFGVDAAALGFDRAAGFARTSARGAEILVAKTEALDRLGDALSTFVGRPLMLERRNVREATRDAARYRAVRDALRFPRATLEAVYAAPLARTFYAPDEIERLVVRWSA